MATSPTDGNISSLSGLSMTIDGQTPVEGSMVLLKNQSSASQNGVYLASAGTWTRNLDIDDNFANPIIDNNTSLYCGYVSAGTVNAGTAWYLTNTGTIAVGSSIQTYSPCLVAQASSTSNLTTTGTQTIDNYIVPNGSLFLAKDQSDTTTNGIYTTGTGRWTKNNNIIYGSYIWVKAGATNSSQVFKVTTFNTTISNQGNFTTANSATTISNTLFGTQTIDGSTTIAGTTIFVKNQTISANNGLYIANANGIWNRNNNDFTGQPIYISGGSSQAGSLIYENIPTNFVQSSGTSYTYLVVAASTGSNIIINTVGLYTLDGIALQEGDLVLLKNQTNNINNGIYIVSQYSWAQYDVSLVQGVVVKVQSGSTNANTYWTACIPFTYAAIDNAANYSYQQIFMATLNGGNPNFVPSGARNNGQGVYFSVSAGTSPDGYSNENMNITYNSTYNAVQARWTGRLPIYTRSATDGPGWDLFNFTVRATNSFGYSERTYNLTRNFINDYIVTTSKNSGLAWIYPGTYSFSIPYGISTLFMTCIGGGGNGDSTGNGGGGGGSAFINISNASSYSGTTYTINVGSANGQSSIVGIITANGGLNATSSSPGSGGTASGTGATCYTGGNGGVKGYGSSDGDGNYYWTNATNGTRGGGSGSYGGTATSSMGGGGGAAAGSNSGAGGNGGLPGSNYGGGGGGGNGTGGYGYVEIAWL